MINFILGEFNCQQNYPSGAALKLSYSPHAGQDFYLSLLSLPYDIPSCPVDVFINLDMSKNMEGLSLYSTCLELSFDQLYFTNLAHRFYIPMSNETMCITSSSFREIFGSEENFGLIIHSSLYPDTLEELTIGLQRFDLLPGEENFAASFGFYKEVDKRVVLLHSVRVNVLGGTLISPIVIEDNKLMFSGVFNLFNEGIYQAHVAGQADISDTDTWESLDIALRGWFSDETGLISMISEGVHSSIQQKADKAERKKNESMLLATARQLNVTLYRLNRAEEEYNKTLMIYERALERQIEAENNLSVATNAVLNATGELKNAERAINDLCTVESCPLECAPTTLSRTIYEDIFVNVTGTCDSICYETVRQRIPPYQESQIAWRFIELCREIQVLCVSGTCYERVCSFQSFSYWDERPVCVYANVTVARQCMKPCTIQKLNRTVEKQETYTSPCGRMVPDQECEASNMACQEQRNQAFSLIQEGLTEPLHQRNMAQAALSNAVNEVIKTEIKKDKAERTLQAAQLLHDIALHFKDINYQIILELIEDGLAFSHLLDNFTVEDIVTIHNVTFDVIDSQESTKFPINIMISTPYNSRMLSLTVSYNFEASFNTQLDSIANKIIELVLEGESTRRRRSLYRVRRTEVEESDYGQEQFEIRCSELNSAYRFVQHLHESLLSLNNSKQNLTFDILESIYELNGTSSMSETFSPNYTSLMELFNITQEEINLLNSWNTNSSVDDTNLSVQNIIADLISDSLEIISTFDMDLFQQWQIDLETLLENSSIAEINCYGVIDCILVLETVLEDLINFGHNTSLAHSLQSAITSLKAVSDSSLTIDDGFRNVVPILGLIEAMVDDGYWCAEPPEIVTHPVAEVNVSIDGMLQLSCEGKSALPLHYRWTKNGVPIPDATTNKYTLSNVKVSDEGTYTCEMTNDVSTVQTIAANVLVYELPSFYLTPVPVLTYRGAASGAWFACNATSRPDPGWRWYHRTADEGLWELIEGEETNELLIEQPNESNKGFYMCVAYNYHGNITSDPVSLHLLGVSVRCSSYPVQFTLRASDDNSKRKRQSKADTNITILLSRFISVSSVAITNVKTEYTSNQTVLTIIFDLIPAESLSANKSLQEIVSNMFEQVDDLEVAKEQLEDYFYNNDISLSLDEQAFAADKSSLTVGLLNILCPSGQELHTNHILCSELYM